MSMVASPPALVPAAAGIVATLVLLTPVVGWTVAAAARRRPSRAVVAAVLTPVLVWTVVMWPTDPVLAVLAVPAAAWGCALALVDVSCHRLPDVLVLTAYPPTGAVLIVAAVGTGDAEALPRAATAAVMALTVGGLAAVTGGIGFGDVKLAGLLALVLGWVSWTAVFAAGLLALGLAAVPALWALARRGRGARFAFGPPLLLGALAAPAVT